MDDTVVAIYEDGVLRLLAPLELPEHTRVWVSVHTHSPADHRQQVREVLQRAGLSAPVPGKASGARPLSKEERAKLARRLDGGRPLSEIIIEEREGR